tara:strand:+ start:55 stop:228 length:174 start_codon:yes stop_codon:yes gene_type:complete
MKFTAEDTKRVNEGIKETQMLIDREESFSFDLRKHEKLNTLKNHLVYLNNVLINEEF